MSSRLQFEQEQQPALTQRYDEDAQREIIALAVQLQKEHESGRSAKEIEAAAEEAGVEPAFVRQAIAQLSSGQRIHVSEQRVSRAHPLLVASTLIATGVAGVLLEQYRHLDTSDSLWLFLIPFTLAALLGTRNSGKGSKRTAFLYGVAVMAAETIGILINIALHSSLPPMTGWNWGAITGFVGMTGVCGVAGTLARKGLDSLNRKGRTLPPVPLNSP